MQPPSPEASGTELCTNWVLIPSLQTILQELKAAGNKVRTVLPIEGGGCVYKAGALLAVFWPGRAGSSEHKVIAVLEEHQHKSAFLVFVYEANCQDGSSCPPSPESDQVSVDAAPKDKKSGLALMLICLPWSTGRKPRCPQGAAGGKRVAKKILAKSGDAAFQYEIMKDGFLSGPACRRELLQHGVLPM